MQRVASSKPFALTARDIEVLRCLVRYRYLRSTYLHAFAGGSSEKRFVERLCDLFHQGLVGRAKRQWEYADARCQPLVHEAEPRANRFLSPDGDSVSRTFLGLEPHRQFQHSLAVCECLASIELAIRTREELRFIPWPEILARAPEQTRASVTPFRLAGGAGSVIPDAIFGIEYRSGGRKAYRFFALEMDRGTMPVTRRARLQSSVSGKFDTYNRFITTGGPRLTLGVPNLFVLTVTPTHARVAGLAEAAADGESSPWLLFKAVEKCALRRPFPPLFEEPWVRAGLPSLLIAEAE